MINYRVVSNLLEPLNKNTPSLQTPWQVDDLSLLCFKEVEDYLQLPAQTLPINLVSRRTMSKVLLETIKDVEENTVKEKDEKMFLLVGTLASPFVALGLSFMARHVLGLYDRRIFSDTKKDLLLVPENINYFSRKMEMQIDEFLPWIVMHEVTHAVHFEHAPHLGEKMKELVENMDNLDTDKVAALMSFVEGLAEHVMDRCTENLIGPDKVDFLREKTNQRRAQGPLLIQLLQKIFGEKANPSLNKMKQYQNGKVFCDYIAKYPGALQAAIVQKEMLPSKQEIESPSLWIKRYEDYQ